MSFNSLCLPFLLLVFACESTPSNNKALNQSTASVENIQTASTNDLPERKEACDFFSVDEIAGFLNWNSATITRELMMSLERYNQTNCHHFTPDGEQFTLRIVWKKEKAQKNKVLENQYKNYRTTGEKGLTYKVVDTQQGSESLFGTGPDRDDKTIYILRTRYENQVSVIIEGAFKKSDPDAFEAIFKNILSKL